MLVQLAILIFAQVAFAKDTVVSVGLNGLTFTPSTITADIGDTVTFAYYPKNHTVTQSSFAAPCTYLTNATTGQSGFQSGFVPVPAGSTEVPSVTMTVNVTTPIWFFCGQVGHCAAGMVGAINPPTSGNKTFNAFLALAKGTNGTSAGPAVTGGAQGFTSGSALPGLSPGATLSAADAVPAQSSSVSLSQPSSARPIFDASRLLVSLSMVGLGFVWFG